MKVTEQHFEFSKKFSKNKKGVIEWKEIEHETVF